MECQLKPGPWPCAGCGAPCGQLVSWVPNRECLRRDFGCPARDAIGVLYPACSRCLNGENTAIAAVEVKVLAILQSEGLIPVA
jgi:hypothetical protein